MELSGGSKSTTRDVADTLNDAPMNFIHSEGTVAQRPPIESPVTRAGHDSRGPLAGGDASGIFTPRTCSAAKSAAIIIFFNQLNGMVRHMH